MRIVRNGAMRGFSKASRPNHIKYLDTLAADGLNLTRTFSGVYIEPPDAFNIAANTLAPKRDRFISLWARGGIVRPI